MTEGGSDSSPLYVMYREANQHIEYGIICFARNWAIGEMCINCPKEDRAEPNLNWEFLLAMQEKSVEIIADALALIREESDAICAAESTGNSATK